MIQIKELKICSLDLDFHEISWTLVETREDVFDYNFQIFRSESPAGPWDPISDPFQDRYVFRDNIIQVSHRWRTYHYKIRVTQLSTGKQQDSSPAMNEPKPDLHAMEIRRHVNHLFQEHAGRRCWLLPVRTFGQRCECWSPALQKKTRSGCVTCYDTSFTRGYLSPIEIWGQIDPSPKADQASNVGKIQQVDTTSRFGAFPPIKPDDLIIEAENIRWRVVRVNQTEKARARIHQEPVLHQIHKRDIEYTIPLDLGTPLRDLSIVPSRNYTNPSSLAAFEEVAIPDILALYTVRRP